MQDLKIVFNLIPRLVPLTQEKKEPGNKVELYSYQAHRQGRCTCNPPPPQEPKGLPDARIEKYSK